MEHCPACGFVSPVHDTRDVPYVYKGRETIIPAVTGYHCAHCGEVTLDKSEVDRFGDLAAAFHKAVDTEPLDPAYIVYVRRKLRLDQKEAGRIFGGGDNAFSRYENGKTRPPLSTVKLLRLLDRHPELLAEVR
jgi:HTH-type transcriptional regulator/antitoxin MqsA